MATSVSSLDIKRWDGTAWRALTPPSQFVNQQSVNNSGVSTSSRHNIWVFPAVSGNTATIQYAAQWNGSAWKVFKLSAKDSVLGSLAFRQHVMRPVIHMCRERGGVFPGACVTCS